MLDGRASADGGQRVVPALQLTQLLLDLGQRGARRADLLLDSTWASLLNRSRNDARDLVAEASKQGWLRLKSAGSVTEITFPNWLPAASGSAPAQEVA